MGKISKNNDLVAKWAIYYFYGFTAFFTLLSIFNINLGKLTQGNFIGLVNLFLLIFFFIQFLGRRIYDIFIIYFLLALAFLVSMLNPANYPYVLSRLLDSQFIFRVCPALFVFRFCDDPEKMYVWLKKISYFVLLVSALYLFSGKYMQEGNMNYMTWGYYAVTSWAAVCYGAFHEKKGHDIFITILMGILLIIYGSRGAMMCIALFLIYCLISSQEKMSRKLVASVSMVCLTIVAYLNFNRIIFGISEIADSLNINSRNIRIILDNSIMQSSIRNSLYNKGLRLIFERPFFGYGVGADNAYLGGEGWNMHNGYLELLLNYGVVLGGIILIALIVIQIYMLIFCRNNQWRGLFSIFSIMSIPQLLFSGSIYLNYEIFLALTLFFAYIRIEKRQSEQLKTI